ncbi:exodeoxyribonuclease VII large subunit [Parasulfuritortus cantonensis]|uniref:Exodeoxyribonuclease 7 large subunit n=1 Tax=Parasulfuritortus cantonensis TaxID=2528202 RepID=A0A4R1B6Z8_9PROT|nr:exodeoxyribonuclease VII large subunit [Parasulfuritortus cantonensis]TCJ11865.1 exodeoxyribonuclease VII large subunit [Parasulfuritortus cantonensis]
MSEAEPTSRVLSVAELNRLARLAVERALPVAWIGGEISNLTRAPSGHWYFTLKDNQAAVRCAMFRNRNQFVDWRPENGMQVEVRAQATLYEARGEFQLSVEAMRRAGLGALFEEFLRIKNKLDKEGLFDPGRKRPLPERPAVVGVVTSPRAAALHDVLTTLRSRWPLARVVLYPTLVQGSTAAAQIAAAIATAGTRAECEVLLLVRGGGGIEDLWSFNDEAVARAIAGCPVPVVSGIGHETDFTIADFAADLRAPTPTAAAQAATPDRAEWQRRVDHLGRTLNTDMQRRLHGLAQRLDGVARRLRHPAAGLAAQSRQVAQLAHRLNLARGATLARKHQALDRLAVRLAAARPDLGHGRSRVATLRQRLGFALRTGLDRNAATADALAGRLGSLNPRAVLERGYGIVRAGDGSILRDPAAVAPGDALQITLARGDLAAVAAEAKRRHPA